MGLGKVVAGKWRKLYLKNNFKKTLKKILLGTVTI